MKLIISRDDLLNHPCEKYDDLPLKETFNAIEEIAKRGGKAIDVLWLIKNCVLAQTPEILEYYKSLKPSFNDVNWFIKKCKFVQTPEILEYFKSLNPTTTQVRWLINRLES